MSEQQSFHISLSGPDQTDALGHGIAAALQRGDTLLLSGTLGAGKSHLARAIIQSRLGRQEDVPSPSFTLVQTYEDPEGDLWHADLYRLGHPDEILELGLVDAFEDSIVLVEWPDRLGDLAPANPIHILLRYDGDARTAEVTFSGRPALAFALAQFCP